MKSGLDRPSIWIGFDPREASAFAVARSSIYRHASMKIPANGIVLDELRRVGLYTRPTEIRDGRLFDVISDHPMATEFAVSRFLVPHLAKSGWALFMDCDMLVRADIVDLFRQCDDRYAMMCVKHAHDPKADEKMDGQVQSRYARKNWSSVFLINCDHPSNRALTVEMVNTAPGRDLHRFCWLHDEEIGELDMSWNWLVGHSDSEIEPDIVHFTEGGPWMPGFDQVPYAEEWRDALRVWAL